MQGAEAQQLFDAWTEALDAAAGEAQARAQARDIRRQERRIARLDSHGDLDERSRRRFETRMADRRAGSKARQYLWLAMALVSASSFGLGVLLAGIIR